MDGQGKIQFIEGSLLEGNFSKGKVQGEASIKFVDGDTYEG